MAAGSRQILRGMTLRGTGNVLRGRPARCVAATGILAAGVLAAGLPLAPQGLAPQGGHRPQRAAVDPAGSGPIPRLTDTLAPEGGPTRLVLGPGGRDVRLSGELTEGAADRLARLLDAGAAVERIHLTSEGGLVDEGTAIGDLIARRGLVTYVPDYCVSACTLAFVRGRERLVLEGSRLGFHAPYEAGPFGIEVEADSAPERAAYLAAGIEPAFVDAALRVPPDGLMIPPAARLVEARVATAVVDAYRFPDSTLDDGADPERARAALLRDVPLLASLEARAPAVVRGIADWYLDGYGRGRSEGEAADGVRRMAARAVAGALREAGPSALAALGRLTLRALDRAGPGRERACAAAGAGIGALLTRGGIAEAELSAARTILLRETAWVGRGLPEPDDAPEPHARHCGALRQALAAALALPPPDAAAFLTPLLFPEPARPRPALEASALPR